MRITGPGYNIDQYYGFHQEFARVNPRTIDELIKYPFNGAGFSGRIWKQKDHMLQVLTEDITTMLVQGKNPQTLVKDFAKRFTTKNMRHTGCYIQRAVLLSSREAWRPIKRTGWSSIGSWLPWT